MKPTMMLPRSLLSYCYIAALAYAAPINTNTDNGTAVFNVASTGGNSSSPFQYGIMFEDINHSGDGGIYAELIMNRAFQAVNFSSATLDPWHSPSFSSLTLQNTSSLSTALPISLNVATDNSINGTVSIANPGYYGIDVRPQDYQGSFYVRGSYEGNFTVSLVSHLTGDTFATTGVIANSTTGQWTQYEYTLSPSSTAPNVNNSLLLEFDGALATDGSLNFNLLSFFPPTYNSRQNGMRQDLMEAWAGINPSFFRAPGGDNIEGLGLAEFSPRWQWNETIGPLTERPGHLNAWGYVLTDGMGLNEYFQLAQDLGMEMSLSVFSGHYLDTTSVAEDDLEPYIQDTIHELEYLTGSVDTPLGALRASHGYPTPWVVNYVEIGNEDNLSGGTATYVSYRYKMYYDALHAAYPNITLIASTQYVPVPNGTVSDYHLYDTPDGLVSAYNYFDQNSTSSSTMIGEFAAVDHNSPAGANVNAPTVPAPFWQGTVSEAIFLIGAERNAGKIFGAAYAPSMGNWNSMQWLTNLLYFDADPASTVLSTSYHMLALFSGTRFTTTRPVTTTTKTAPLYWVAGTDEATGAGIAKLAVYNSTGNVPVRLNFDGVGKTANLTVLTAPSWDSFNSVGHDVVVSNTTMVQADSTGAFAFSLPDLSIAVLVTEGGGSMVNGTGAVRGAGQKGKIVWETADGKLYASS